MFLALSPVLLVHAQSGLPAVPHVVSPEEYGTSVFGPARINNVCYAKYLGDDYNTLCDDAYNTSYAKCGDLTYPNPPPPAEVVFVNKADCQDAQTAFFEGVGGNMAYCKNDLQSIYNQIVTGALTCNYPAFETPYTQPWYTVPPNTF